MYHERIYLEDYFPNLPKAQSKTSLTFYIPELPDAVNCRAARPCAVICPGGGYSHVSRREAEPVALRLAGNGIPAAVVDYACDGERYPVQLLQVLAAVTHIRRCSSQFYIHPDRIAVMGFSAGGHAACSAGLFWQEEFVREALGIRHEEARPNGMVLCYPVINSGKYAHQGSFRCLLGENPDPALLEKMSLEKQVTENAPQAFLWHTAEDEAVPVENSLLLAMALREKGIPVELHVYPHGGHGLSLGDDTVDPPESIGDAARYCAGWISHCIRWLREVL